MYKTIQTESLNAATYITYKTENVAPIISIKGSRRNKYEFESTEENWEAFKEWKTHNKERIPLEVDILRYNEILGDYKTKSWENKRNK